VAPATHIARHFIRSRYPNLKSVLGELEREGRVERVEIKDWPGEWHIHTDDLPVLEQLDTSRREWGSRTVLLSPFDNLICDRARTELMFGFEFRIEIYVPQAQRKYGYYVLPILHGDRLIGRVDPKMDRTNGQFVVNAVYAEPDAPKTRAAARAVAAAIEDLASFLGAKEIVYDRKRVPAAWRRDLMV
jgi:hypothetical protein